MWAPRGYYIGEAAGVAVLPPVDSVAIVVDREVVAGVRPLGDRHSVGGGLRGADGDH